jgi:magnesium transporter
MLSAFVVTEGRLELREDGIAALRAGGLVWLDICEPTEEEIAAVRSATALEFGQLEPAENMESSARYYQVAESGALHLRADFLTDAGNHDPQNAAVQLVILGETLYSFHHVDLPTFRIMRESAASNPAPCSDAKDVMLEIYATDAEYCADLLEGIHRQLKGASHSVLTRTVSDKIAGAVLARLAHQEDLNSNVRHNINDNRRAISFLTRERHLSQQQLETARQIRRDLDSLDAYTTFLFDKINFLLEATVGFINITQNNVVKIFSVAAVAMLPPTLIASIYGMNFRHIPELDWTWGYPFALTLMALSVVLPFLWFRRKGWLK